VSLAYSEIVQKRVFDKLRHRIIASGTWDLLGRGCIHGAGGGKWTERLAVRFAWLAAA